MNRRQLLQALLAAPVVANNPHRVYSFLWDNPLVRSVTDDEVARIAAMTVNVNDVLKHWYSAAKVETLLGHQAFLETLHPMPQGWDL